MIQLPSSSGKMDLSVTRPVFVAGASGYIGGRLVPRLLVKGYRIRCLARSPKKLTNRSWSDHPGLEIVEGDLADTDQLAKQLSGCGTAYYLAHSMLIAGPAAAARDRDLAKSFATATSRARCQRIIYLGGLGETGTGRSEHLASRLEVERSLASSSVPVTVLRAALIIGSGSACFGILRHLVERLPLMVTPRWVRTQCQPIAESNVLYYLIRALEVPETVGSRLDIGGPAIISYRKLMWLMARSLGLPRPLEISLPMSAPRLSALWIHIITPLSYQIARSLTESLCSRLVCRDDRAAQLMPQRLLSAREAIDTTLAELAEGDIETSWRDAGAIAGDPDWAKRTHFTHQEQIEIRAEAAQVFQAVCRIGGPSGWYAANSLWRLRGLVDRLMGGPGLRRGRRHASEVRHGDAIDFWRVTALESNRILKLRAEMKLPGEALLEFRIEPKNGKGGFSRLTQIARFQPKGLLGFLYWYGLKPLHSFVFRGMVNGIRESAESVAAAQQLHLSQSNERCASEVDRIDSDSSTSEVLH